jgi:hypothetical protein
MSVTLFDPFLRARLSVLMILTLYELKQIIHKTITSLEVSELKLVWIFWRYLKLKSGRETFCAFTVIVSFWAINLLQELRVLVIYAQNVNCDAKLYFPVDDGGSSDSKAYVQRVSCSTKSLYKIKPFIL